MKNGIVMVGLMQPTSSQTAEKRGLRMGVGKNILGQGEGFEAASRPVFYKQTK